MQAFKRNSTVPLTQAKTIQATTNKSLLNTSIESNATKVRILNAGQRIQKLNKLNSESAGNLGALWQQKDLKQFEIEPEDPKILSKLQAIIYNGGTARFHFLAQNPLPDPPAPTPPTPPIPPVTQDELPGAVNPPNSLLWQQTAPLNIRTRKRILVFKQIQYIIANWSGDKFPSVLYICVDGFPGYFDKFGDQTDRVAALQLQDVNPVLDDAQLRTYDLKYAVKQNVNWELPPAITVLNLRIRADDDQTSLVLPLPNPISINMEIRSQ